MRFIVQILNSAHQLTTTITSRVFMTSHPSFFSTYNETKQRAPKAQDVDEFIPQNNAIDNKQATNASFETPRDSSTNDSYNPIIAAIVIGFSFAVTFVGLETLLDNSKRQFDKSADALSSNDFETNKSMEKHA